MFFTILMKFCLIKPHSVGRYFVLEVRCTGLTLTAGNNLLLFFVHLTYQLLLNIVVEFIICFIIHTYLICTPAITYHNNMQAHSAIIITAAELIYQNYIGLQTQKVGELFM